MQIQVKTDGHIDGGAQVTDEVEAVVQQALVRFDDRITRVEVFLSDDNSGEKFGGSDKCCVIEARLGGLRPVAASHRGSSLDQAVAGAADKLDKMLKRILERKGSLAKRRARKRAELNSAGPLLDQDRQAGQRDEFMKVLCPLLGHLGQHARRELRIMEANGTLYPGQVVFASLLDEVVSRAWRQFADRPQWLAIDLWLTKILDEILEEASREEERTLGPVMGPADEMERRGVPQVDDQEWWVRLLGEDETLAEDEAAECGQNTWAETFLEAEELMDRIHALLGKLPKLQRRAFVLNVFETYDMAEIALLQGRAEKDVRDDIHAAHIRLRELLRGQMKSHVSAKQAIRDYV